MNRVLGVKRGRKRKPNEGYSVEISFPDLPDVMQTDQVITLFVAALLKIYKDKTGKSLELNEDPSFSLKNGTLCIFFNTPDKQAADTFESISINEILDTMGVQYEQREEN